MNGHATHTHTATGSPTLSTLSFSHTIIILTLTIYSLLAHNINIYFIKNNYTIILSVTLGAVDVSDKTISLIFFKVVVLKKNTENEKLYLFSQYSCLRGHSLSVFGS